jgi:hypothetical protein
MSSTNPGETLTSTTASPNKERDRYSNICASGLLASMWTGYEDISERPLGRVTFGRTRR